MKFWAAMEIKKHCLWRDLGNNRLLRSCRAALEKSVELAKVR